jgi:DNA polymerase-3 subunit delta
MSIPFHAFMRDLKKKDPSWKLPNVVAVGGNERGFLNEAIAAIRQKALEGGAADFNHDRASAKKSTIQEILGLAETLPMMGPCRLVEVAAAESIDGRDLPILEAYLNAPVQSAVLLFVFDKLDKRQKVVKLLDKSAELVVCETPRENEMANLARERARSHGIKLDGEAVAALILVVGTDLLMLERALEKLALAVEGRPCTVDDIDAHVAQSRLADAFVMGRAVALGNRREAMKVLAQLRAFREPPIKLVGLLAWQLRQVLQARSLLDEGASEKEVGEALRLFGSRLKPTLKAARKWDERAHARRLARLAHLDRSLKSSRSDPWLWMERVVMQLCPPSRQR